MEYVQSIGSLYFIKKEHRKLAEQKFKLFLSYLRNRYRIPTQVIDEAFIKKVASTSKVDEQQVHKVVDSYKEFESKLHMNEDQLISFNNYLEYFYKNCK
jgi:NADH:ubiquinone oxidoreductase subunit E